MATAIASGDLSKKITVDVRGELTQLGGDVVVLSSRDMQSGRGETPADTARVLSRYVDAIMIRTDDHAKVEEMAHYATVPVINGLTDKSHPVQVLADIQTFEESLGPIKGHTIAWVGDGNNMANTWLQAADLLGFTVHVSTPSGYEIDQSVAGLRSNDSYKVFKDPMAACQGADLVTTDVWTSMGYEAENEERLKAFVDWCVDDEMMAVADTQALFMHCLPAHRGEEVTAEVIDGPQSVVWDEAENRMHVQKALMEWLLLGSVN